MIKIIIRTIYITKRNQIFFAPPPPPPHPPSVPIIAGIYLLGWGTLCKTPRTVSVSPARRMPPRDLMLFMVCLNSSSERSLVASYAIRTRPGIRGLWSLVLSTVPVELDDDISLINRIPHNEFNLLNILHSITGMGIKAAAHIKGSMQQMNNRTITNLHDKMGLWEWVLAQSQIFFWRELWTFWPSVSPILFLWNRLHQCLEVYARGYSNWGCRGKKTAVLVRQDWRAFENKEISSIFFTDIPLETPTETPLAFFHATEKMSINRIPTNFSFRFGFVN